MSTVTPPKRSVPSVGSPTAVIAVLCVALAEAERRAAQAERDAGDLREQLRALESWLDDTNRVEHLQRGRLLALAAEERASRRRRTLVASPAAVVLLMYALTMIALVYVLLFAHI